MIPPLLGTVTIGQAPRSDIAPILAMHLPPTVGCLHVGVLDGLAHDVIAARFAPRAGAPTLITRLLDGSAVVLDKAAVRQVLQQKIDALEQAGCTVVLVLCTGEFDGLRTRQAWLVEPDRIVPPAAAALAGTRQAGTVVPLPSQIASEYRKWQGLAHPPLCSAASPYGDDDAALAAAARDLRERGAELLILDCMGFVERHRAIARAACGLPVILSNALIARLTAELL
ncbi:AroM family protein [Robbsia sp. Bb-Pol-6]|uniref:AroM family protein n=1 Tax=Robbsia betulipollinis TaxID=2981849 RepID=A0ABT3ZUE5_9BURK|nr:AroM family protein [Robbsia betulipollinis]MCY0389463.1 AroM family protein [Robbsia betulipollinis]